MKLSLTLALLLFTGYSEAAIGKHNNTLGTVIYEENPYSYKAGAVLTGFDIDDGKGLVLRIQPSGTYNLFTEDVLFCGSPTDMLDGKSNPMVLVYKTVAHRLVRDVGCHELIKVMEIKTEKLK